MISRTKSILSMSLIMATILFSIDNAVAEGKSGYQLLKKTVLGGQGGWDLLNIDNNEQKLYISHNDHVEVINLKSGKFEGIVKNTSGVHGIAVDNNLGKGYTSNGKTNSVSVFELKTLKVIKDIKVDIKPDTIIYDNFSKMLFVFNAGSNNVSVINPDSEKVISTIALGGAPEFAVSDAQGKIFVNLEDKSEVVEFDAKTFKVLKHWGLGAGEAPSGLAIDKKNHLLFSGCENNLLVVTNYQTGKVTAELPIGKGVDAVAFDPETGLVFSSNGEGTITVIHEDSDNKFSVVENVETKRGARTMALDLKTHHVFVDTSELGAPPAPTVEKPHPRPKILPGTFMLLEYGKK